MGIHEKERYRVYRHSSYNGVFKYSCVEQHGILRLVYCPYFSPLGQHLRQDNGHFSFFRRGMADCSRACSSGNSTDFAGSARGRWNNKADSQENLCREVLPVCEGILSVHFLGASVRLPDYDPELLYPVPCFQLFRKIFRRKYRGADPGTVDYCLQSGGGKL